MTNHESPPFASEIQCNRGQGEINRTVTRTDDLISVRNQVVQYIFLKNLKKILVTKLLPIKKTLQFAYNYNFPTLTENRNIKIRSSEFSYLNL